MSNQSYHWKLNQSEVAISGRLANQIVRSEPIRRGADLQYVRVRTIYTVTESSLAFCLFDRPCPYSPAGILLSLSASKNLIIFYELALLLVICPFPAILFSLSAAYNLIIFYELALSLVICPFPTILYS